MSLTNDFLQEMELKAPPLEVCGKPGGDAVCPDVFLSACERAEKERIIRFCCIGNRRACMILKAFKDLINDATVVPLDTGGSLQVGTDYYVYLCIEDNGDAD